MMDKWTEYVEHGGQIDVMYGDFEKAFDKVPHKRSISKLRSYGFDNIIIMWVQDFIDNIWNSLPNDVVFLVRRCE